MRWTVAAALLAAAAPAAGSTFVASSVEEMARSSEAVARGSVVSVASRVARDGRIVTDVDIAVAAAWKGAPGERVRVTVPGGEAGGVGLRVDGAPSFERGEDVVVFLARKAGAWRVNGWALGKYRVVDGEARPSLGGADVLPRAIPAGERLVGPLPVAELERRVRSAR